ncbi:hypothetical protein CPB83DRAFT_858083 [Crepidotus variabilis]|uniref:MHC class I region proline-rich protein CAT53 n=1 Tax=Crepidotus variabilis TaxID=179855 RepID=A0A9P6EBW8_9AGAR|nr:hypothetical protein CPB83DRAFT_858083 [Crepidotus variabilis]
MESNLYSQWVATQIPEPSQQQALSHNGGAQHEASTRGLDDWSKDRSQNVNTSGLPGHSPTMTAQTMDLNDYTTLGDLSSSTSSSFYNPYLAGIASLYPSISSTLSPYNAIPYGQQWAAAPSQIPVSSYSSLNGATTAPSTSQSHQTPQVHQPVASQIQTSPPPQPTQHSPSHQMIIDPLLTLNSTSSSLQNAFSSSAAYPSISAQQQSQSQQSPQTQAAQPISQRSYFNQPLMYSPAYYRPPAQSSPQGTLSPQALHSPSVPMMQNTFYAHPQSQTQLQSALVSPPPASQTMVSSITPMHGETPSGSTINSASFSAAASGPTPEEKEERKRKFLNNLRPLLQSSAFSGAQAVQHLTDRIADYGLAEVEAQTRLDILARIRDGAGNHYYRAWSENPLAVEITREWLKAAAKDNSGALQETAMPLLHLIDRLPFNLVSLASSKLGKVIRSLGKGDRSSAIKDMASNLERRWLDMLSVKEENGKEDTKKRKANESNSTNKAAAPNKKAAIGSSSSTKPVIVKREVKAALPPAPVKDAKADSSFFSAPKPKAKLPSFKKALAPPLLKKDESGSSNSSNVSQPINFNPFEEALKSMKVQRRDSPASATPPSQMSLPVNGPQSSLAKSVRKRKSVTWASDDKLEVVKLIERAIYDDDPTEGVHGMHTSRDLDREEGAALHAHLFEETADWSEPVLIEMPPEPDPSNPRILPRGSSSQEKATQDEREAASLSAIYAANQIPDSPAEPASVISEEDAMKDAKDMELGEEFTNQFFPNGSMDMGTGMAVDPVADVSTLIGQLHSNVPMDTSPITEKMSASLPTALAGFQPEQVQQLLAQLSSTMGAAGQSSFTQFPSATGNGGDAAWGTSSAPQQFPSDYSQVYGEDGDKQFPGRSGWDDRGGRGGRGRGASRGTRGRGDDWGGKPYPTRKSRPCVFFQQQRCKYGDQCDFLHELVPSGER